MTYQQIKELYQKHGHRFYEGLYNVNLYGVRTISDEVDQWNDVLGVAYQDAYGNEINIQHEGTTKPGLYYLKNKMGNINGTAILQPGQYSKCWQIGKHNGKYTALRQIGVFKVWRDNDKDGKHDYSGDTYLDVTGLNMHTESLLRETERVGAYSAGCQVRRYDREHFMVMEILKRSAEIYSDIFSYTLFEH